MFRVHRPTPEDCGVCEERITNTQALHRRVMLPAIAAAAMGVWGLLSGEVPAWVFHGVSFVLVGGGLGYIWELSREARDYERENKQALIHQMKVINDRITENKRILEASTLVTISSATRPSKLDGGLPYGY
jgi:hypothetical protein